MSLGDELRAALRSVVQKAREVLTDDLREVFEAQFGIHRDGRFETIAQLPALLGDPGLRETRELLEKVLPAQPRKAAERDAFGAAFDAVIRSIAFTHLNRFFAFKMMEHPSRKLIRETVGPNWATKGLAYDYLSTRPDEERRWTAGERDEVYRRFLLFRCEELHREIGVLFDPDDLASRVFPRPPALKAALELINGSPLEGVWTDEETLGWVYQYYTPKELKDEARKKSPNPRDANEMAFRNQFYTPDYVVRFLTDNTLGRLWAEMLSGTSLRERCTYLLVRPGEQLPTRAKKDPRRIRVLDPASGSGHFLLYAFELLEVIYAEAFDDPELGPALAREFTDRDSFLAQVPKLIIENNLHGFDIDRRAVQIASLVLFLKAKGRNKALAIEKSHLVCAEPMPNAKALLDDFKEKKLGGTEGTLARILDGVIDRMGLAGEAGSLLKIEADIDQLVRDEREKWREHLRLGPEQVPLLPGIAPEGRQSRFDDVSNEQFWEQAESRIIELLREFVGEAGGAERAQRRMFARDGAEGLRLVDALRRRYDVVLMNPPFGTATDRAQNYVDERYPASRQDVAACFIERAVQIAPHGYVGAITTEALFFRRTLEDFRKRVLLKTAELEAMAHLGGHVLDGATVRTAAYVLAADPSRGRRSQFVRLLGKEDKPARLIAAAHELRAGLSPRYTFLVAQAEFEKLPYAVFGYWCSPKFRSIFGSIPSLEAGAGSVRQGLATADDFRFVRLKWETRSPTRPGWVPFAKGGDYSPFLDDIHLMLKWESGGIEQFAWGKGRPQNIGYFGRPGLTFPLRTNKRFAPRVLSAGAAFGHKGPSIFVEGDDQGELAALLAVLNSRAASYLLSLALGTTEAEGGAGANSYEVGLVQRLPVPSNALKDATLRVACLNAITARRAADTLNETTSSFRCPFISPPAESVAALAGAVAAALDSARHGYVQAQRNIDQAVNRHYSLGPSEVLELDEQVGSVHELAPIEIGDLTLLTAERIISWCVGVVFGRFDVRVGTGQRQAPAATEHWAKGTARSPGMLPEGGVPPEYPIKVDEDGILVDDDGHADDITTRVRAVLAAVWKDRAQTLEKELCDALGARSLRDYLTRPGAKGFWVHHFATYSKSKRRAPLYWLLRSMGGRYSVWLYSQRVDKDTLYKVLGSSYLGGKLARVRNEIERLRPGGHKKDGLTRAEEKVLERLDDELTELEGLRQAVERVTSRTDEQGRPTPYDPDLDDGVILAAAPLHQMIPWPKKKKVGDRQMTELEAAWHALESGKYDWSSVARRYWPDRVEERSRADLSIAIAHSRDGAYHPGKRTELEAKAKAAAAVDEADAGAEPSDDTDEENDE